MPSNLRYQTTFDPVSAQFTEASYPHTIPLPPPAKKQKMTITQTYRLAHSARGKLSSEASRGDHDLRLLVGHANLLDGLMVELQDAEREQEEWFNETMKSAAPQEPRRVQWKDELASNMQELSDSEDDDDEEEDFEEVQIPVQPKSASRRSRSPPASSTRFSLYDEEDEEEDEDDDMDSDDEYDNLDLALVRTRSHSEGEPHPIDPPELVHDASDDSDDESPVSPPGPSSVDVTKLQQKHGIIAKDFAAAAASVSHDKVQEAALMEDGFYLPPTPSTSPMIAAC